ncbi:TRAP transporter substrate-binding protein DctP [Aquamicrobium sp. LC103]|uniref:TRAP transporter substrate-binding protein n=1 Tax=Aquamicrobium sp. LC103 TaxID=1120658 RepID=UPI00063EC855|nr:TRAP transporter substrate-binding protein DctP [Aquamicrobium sp. LC103]TKT69476.1 C4-dicarboxylate ABC transporter [Aquamicrobium sp. LC103]
MVRPVSVAAGCAVLIACVPAGSASAQETVSLRVGDVYPQGHYMAEALVKPWMDQLKERLGERVEVSYFPASQLGKGPDFLSLTQSGAVDVGVIVPPLVPDKFPLSAVAELPGSFSEGCEGTRAFWKLAREGVLKEEEFDPNGIHLLLALVLPPYQLFSSKPVESIESFRGQKIYATGGAKDLTVRAVGAVPIRLATNELYESLSRGTIDGGLMGFGTALSYSATEYARYATTGENFGSGVITYGIAKPRWEALPEDVRAAMDELGEKITFDACAAIDASVPQDAAKMKAGGVTLVKLPEADRSKVDAAMAGIANQWAAELDGQGRKGTAVLDAFRSELGGH